MIGKKRLWSVGKNTFYLLGFNRKFVTWPDHILIYRWLSFIHKKQFSPNKLFSGEIFYTQCHKLKLWVKFMVSVIEIQSVSNNNAHYFLKFVKTFSLRKKKKVFSQSLLFSPSKKKKKKSNKLSGSNFVTLYYYFEKIILHVSMWLRKGDDFLNYWSKPLPSLIFQLYSNF